MIWDALLVSAVATELGRRLEGARLRAIHLDPLGQRVFLFFREVTLGVDLTPGGGALTVSDPLAPIPGSHALPARVVDVTAPLDDRVLFIRLKRTRGTPGPWLCALELVTHQWNAVVAEGEELRVRGLLRSRAGERPLAVGALYRPPRPSVREGKDGRLSRARWRELLEDV